MPLARKEIIHILFDRSGSLIDSWEEMVEAVNHELERYRHPQDTGNDTTIEVSITPFNDSVGETLTYVMPTEIPRFTISDWDPIGRNSFCDAMGVILEKIRTGWASERKQREVSVYVVVFVFGCDQSSQTYSLPQVRSTIAYLEATGEWRFRFAVDDLPEMESNAVLALRHRYANLQNKALFKQDLMSIFFENKDDEGPVV